WTRESFRSQASPGQFDPHFDPPSSVHSTGRELVLLRLVRFLPVQKATENSFDGAGWLLSGWLLLTFVFLFRERADHTGQQFLFLYLNERLNVWRKLRLLEAACHDCRDHQFARTVRERSGHVAAYSRAAHSVTERLRQDGR